MERFDLQKSSLAMLVVLRSNNIQKNMNKLNNITNDIGINTCRNQLIKEKLKTINIVKNYIYEEKSAAKIINNIRIYKKKDMYKQLMRKSIERYRLTIYKFESIVINPQHPHRSQP